MPRVDDFAVERERLNELVLARADLLTKRFFALDADAYADGALPRKTKELMGLVASLVLRCDDCVAYHLARSAEEGATEGEIVEAMGIALVVGGSIVIPHLRRAYALLAELKGGADG
ncbi:MAG: carboxymuconolactone decarboxylase family protein [Caldiserica bacterium]|nr:carboxymuconolactone decarboxylase family protein [Caldisericota bacterium]